MRVFKEFTFEASHSLPHLSAGHKCHGMHGHSYTVRVIYEGVEDMHTGFVVDYADITAQWKAECKPSLDHQDLNKSLNTDHTTSEYLCKWIWRRMLAPHRSNHALVEVVVRETSTAGAIYNGE